MTSQMFVDLIVQKMMDGAKEEGGVSSFSLPFLGTLAGSIVIIDSIPEPVPLSKFQFLVDYRTTTKPVYEDGDRLLIVPIGDGGYWIIIGRLI